MEKAVEFLKKHADIAVAASLFLITLLFFLPTLSFDEIPLDAAAYTDKKYLLLPTWQNFIYHLKTPILNLYSPLVMHSLMLDYWVWGEEFFHAGGILHNILLHGLNTVMFFMLLRQLKLVRFSPEKPQGLSIAAAGFAALCFALHPQRVESVVWIVERKDVLMLFFGLLATLIFTHAYRKNSVPLSIAGAIVYLLSFGVKPTLISLPAVLLLGIWVCTEKLDWRKIFRLTAPYFATAFAYIGINFSQVGSFAGASADGMLSASRLWVVASNYTNYFFKTLIPANIQPLYAPFPMDGRQIMLAVIFWALAAAAVVLAIVKWKYRKIFLAFLAPLMLAFLGTLLPSAGLQTIGNAEFADRYSYYPSLFIWIGMAVAYEFYSSRRPVWQFSFWGYAALTAVLGYCYMQSWQTKEAFINAAIGDGQNINPTALRMAAWVCYENKDFDAAIGFAGRAVEISSPENENETRLYYHAMLGMIALEQNDVRGLALIDQAITSPDWGILRMISPGFAENVLLKSAEIHWQMYRIGGNRADLDFTVQIYMVLGHLSMGADPAKDYSYQAYAAYLTGDYRKAEELTLQALHYAPEDENLLQNLATFRELLRTPPAAEASN